jgi:uncharacterized protein YwqG
MSSLPSPLREQLESALRQCKFSESDCEACRNEAAECWYLHVREEDSQTVGRSRMCGLPDLPEGMAWPRGNNGAFSFVMQIRLDDAGGILPFGMPSKGMLYFFVENDELAMNVKHRLIWVEDTSSLQTAELPPLSEMNADYIRSGELIPHAIEMMHGVDVPISEIASCLDFYERDDAVDLMTRFESLLKGTSDAEATAGKLFGYQCRRGHGPCKDVALLSLSSDDSKPLSSVAHDAWNRLKVTKEAYADSPHKIEEEMAQWCQLLQIDSNFNVGFNIWDAGSYQVMLRHSDIAQREFGKSHVMLETC